MRPSVSQPFDATPHPGDPRVTDGGVTVRNSPDLQTPLGGYSHVATHAGVAYLSGQLPVTPEGVVLAGESFEVQTRQVLANLDACLQAAGSSRDKLLLVTVFVTDMAHWATFDDLYRAWLGGHRPARAVAGASTLHYGAAIEIQATAVAG